MHERKIRFGRSRDARRGDDARLAERRQEGRRSTTKSQTSKGVADRLRRYRMNQADIRFGALTIALALAVGATAQVAAQARQPEPLSIARQGYVFAGGKYSTVNGRQVMS